MSLLFDREKPTDVKSRSIDTLTVKNLKPESPNGLIFMNGI